MSASYSALWLGWLPWRIKCIQEMVWTASPLQIMAIDDELAGLNLVLPALANHMSKHQRDELAALIERIRARHAALSDMNVSTWFEIIKGGQDSEEHFARYHSYIVEDANLMLKDQQAQDRHNIRDLLATIVKHDPRLQGYYEIGDHVGEMINHVGTGVVRLPLSDDQQTYIHAGLKTLPLREQAEISQFLVVPDTNAVFDVVVPMAKALEKLGRFLNDAEQWLLAKPQWNGKDISYRGNSEQIKIQRGRYNKSVIGRLLDSGENEGWPDSFILHESLDRSIKNAVYNFNREHHILHLSVNGDRVFWGPPGTVTNVARRA